MGCGKLLWDECEIKTNGVKETLFTQVLRTAPFSNGSPTATAQLIGLAIARPASSDSIQFVRTYCNPGFTL
jgi:hypothetical protein